jgi:flagellar hook-length control protein FliK
VVGDPGKAAAALNAVVAVAALSPGSVETSTAALAVDPVAPVVASPPPRRGTKVDSAAMSSPVVVNPPAVQSRAAGAGATATAVAMNRTEEPSGHTPPSDVPEVTHSSAANRPARADRSAMNADHPAPALGANQSKPDGDPPTSLDGVHQLNAQSQTQGQVVPTDQAGTAKTVTVVSEASPATPLAPAVAGAKLRDALASVANHAVLRSEASGQIDVPELGRVAVRAHSSGGTVDVEVTAESTDARAMLRGHVGAMTADLHAADVPVGRFTVDRTDAPSLGSSTGSSTSSRDGGNNQGGQYTRDGGPQADAESVSEAAKATVPRRVRIVL